MALSNKQLEKRISLLENKATGILKNATAGNTAAAAAASTAASAQSTAGSAQSTANAALPSHGYSVNSATVEWLSTSPGPCHAVDTAGPSNANNSFTSGGFNNVQAAVNSAINQINALISAMISAGLMS